LGEDVQRAAPREAPKRRRSDYHDYYWAQCKKCAPRTIDWDHHAYEAVLGLLMFDYPEKTESDCVIALAKMGLYAPLVGPRESSRKR
jgi:hypothetical protein